MENSVTWLIFLLALCLFVWGVKTYLNLKKENDLIAKEQRASSQNRNELVINGIDIPFNDLVILLVKVALAGIPALFILVLPVAFFLTIIFMILNLGFLPK